MYFLSISIKSDCGLSRAAQSSEKKIITLNLINKLNLNNIVAFTLSQDIQTLKDGLLTDFKKYNILKGKKSSFIFGVKDSHGIIPSILDSSSIPLFPFYAENGNETFQLLTPDKDSIDILISYIEKTNKIETTSYERILDGDSLHTIFRKINRIAYISNLTDMEMKIVRRALNEGFYSWPRSFDLMAISNSFNLTKPTVLYHLRNAERKIMESLFGQ
ncbi:MAG: helix-turn-helix domain-containing protein [Thermoplasmata archaeon]